MQNVNVGVLGHVDSGKTSLVRALSTQLSTAALDKHPQSQQRGMTLDLGFSSFLLALKNLESELQVTLVDCPGHASLFRTILGGVSIIDSVLVVVDVRKGLQPQTVESLLLAALISRRSVVVALTKVDLLEIQHKSDTIAEVSNEIRHLLSSNFKFQDNVPVVPVAVAAGVEPEGISTLLDVLRETLHVPARNTSGAFRLAVDHCFAVPGNGTVLTGTVLSGALQKGDEVELLPLGARVKVKTLQVFKNEVDSCQQGDRVGVRVNGLDPALVERAVAVSPPGSLAPVTQVVIPVTRVPFFRGVTCKSGGKCHATVGHTTVIATATFFSRLGDHGTSDRDRKQFDPSELYEYVSEVDFDNAESRSTAGGSVVFALLQFESVVFCPPEALVVCSRLDLDAKKFSCRLSFYGAVQSVVGSSNEEVGTLSTVHQCVVDLSTLRIGRVRNREGFVDKIVESRGNAAEGATEVIGRDMFSKDVNWDVYKDTIVLFEQTRVLGSIVGPFGKAGKFRMTLRSSLHSAIPTSGEKFVLRFLKLTTLKPPKLKGKLSGKTAKAPATTTSKPGQKKDNTRSLIQDVDLLYPEAFTKSLLTNVDSETLTVDTVVISVAQNEAVEEFSMANKLVVARRRGRIERLKGETSPDGKNPFAIVSGLFETEQEANAAVNRYVRCISEGVDSDKPDQGRIEKPFGKAGKVRVDFQVCGGTLGQVGDMVELC